MLPILFRSTDAGAPVLNNVAGSLISVLDACLVTGFNSVGIVSLTVVANVCTVVTATNHNYQVSDRALVAGATATALNGDKSVLTVPTPTSFTFSVTLANTSETPASASVKRTPLGWLKEFTGTNKAVYKMSDPQSYGQRLRVVDDAASPLVARVMGVEFPTTVDAFADKFPTELQLAGGGFWGKGANNSTAKYWAICGDDRFFYFICEGTGYTGVYTNTFAHVAYCFGDPISFRQAEAYGAVLFSGSSSNGLTCDLGTNTNPGSAPPVGTGNRICRQFTGITKSPLVGCLHPTQGKPGANTSPQYPSSVDNGMIFTEPTFLVEESSAATNPIRAQLPGFMTLLARGSQLPDALGPTIYDTTDGKNTRIVTWKNCYTSSTPDWVLSLKLSADWRV